VIYGQGEQQAVRLLDSKINIVDIPFGAALVGVTKPTVVTRERRTFKAIDTGHLLRVKAL
jgi:hypothetical protein